MNAARALSPSLHWVAAVALVHCFVAAPAAAEDPPADAAPGAVPAPNDATSQNDGAVQTAAQNEAASQSSAAAPNDGASQRDSAAAAQSHGAAQHHAAAQDDRAAQLNERGLALYAAQDYRHALEHFIGALALEEDPNLLFNIGRCYEQLGQLDAALEKYEQFVAAPESDAAGVARARASIEGIAAARQARKRASPRASFPLVRSFPVSSSAAVDPGAMQTSGVPWLLVGGTVAFAAAGATVYALGARDHAQVTRLPEYGKGDVRAAMTWRRASSLVASGKTKKLAGGVLLGLGGALGVTTIALLLSQDHEREPEPAVAVVPAVLGSGGGLLLAGRFR